MDFDFQSASPKPTTLVESHQLIHQLWENCRLLQSTLTELEEKFCINSSNSSLPPSNDSIKEKASKRKERDAWHKRTPAYWKKRRQGAQPGHKGMGRALIAVDEVDEIIPCYPDKLCLDCGGCIEIGKLRQRKQIFDLPVGALHVTEYQIYAGCCLRCKKVYRGELPEGIPRGILGVNTLAKIAILTGKYRLSKREVKEFLFDFFALKVCIGTVSNAEGLVSRILKKPAEEIGDAITTQDYLHADETGHNHKGGLEWLWVATNDQLTYFKIYQHRNQTCAKALMGETFSGMIITDRYGAYNWLSQEQRQYCWAHLKRDFQKIADRLDPEASKIGHQLLDSFTAIFYHWHKIRDGTFYPTSCIRNAIRDLYDNLRRGRKLVEAKTAKFCAKLIRERKSLWHFLNHDSVSPTNNHAERQIRHAVIWRKKCYGTQSKRGILFVERILTIIKTCQQKERGLIEFISDSINARWCNTLSPSLIH